MDKIQKIINDIIDAEGGYVNDPQDPGGETIYGITKKVARENFYMDEMEHMPRSFAEHIYRKHYITDPKFDLLLPYSELIAAEVIDTGVNCGQKTAARFLQETLNLFNNDTKYYPDLNVDGLIGNATASALSSFLDKRKDEGEKILHFTLNCRQVSYYASLNMEKYIYGWIKNRAYKQVIGE